MSSKVTPDDITRLARDCAKTGWLYGYMEGCFELIRVMKKQKLRKFLEKYVKDELAKEGKYEQSIFFRLQNMKPEERDAFIQKLEKINHTV